MYKITLFVALAVFGVANAGVVGPYGLGLAGVHGLGLAGVHGVGLAGVHGLGVNGLGLAGVHGLGVNGLGLAGVHGLGLAGVHGLGVAGVHGLGLAGVHGLGLGHGIVGPHGAIGASGAIASNPGGTIAAAVPGINYGVAAVGPKTAATVVGVQSVLDGPSATLITSTGAVKGVASAGANIGGIQVAPAAHGGNIPASATAILKAPIGVHPALAHPIW